MAGQQAGRAIGALETSGAAWSYGAFDLMDESGRPLPKRVGTWAALSGRIADALIADVTGAAIGTLVVDAEVFRRLGGFDEDPALNFREDYEFAIRLARDAEAVACEEVLTTVRVHTARATNTVADAFLRSARALEPSVGISAVGWGGNDGPRCWPGPQRTRWRRAIIGPASGFLAAAAGGAGPLNLLRALVRGSLGGARSPDSNEDNAAPAGRLRL